VKVDKIVNRKGKTNTEIGTRIINRLTEHLFVKLYRPNGSPMSS